MNRLTEPATTKRELHRACRADTRLIDLPRANGTPEPPVALEVYAVELARSNENVSGLPVKTWPGPGRAALTSSAGEQG